MRHFKSVSHFVLFSSIFLFASRSPAQQNPAPAPAAPTVPVPARITQAIDEKNLVTLKGNVHPLTRPEFDQGPVSDAQPMRRMLLLLQRSPDQETALQQLLEDQQNKSSAIYHAWLTPDQFGKQFGPADADIQTITQWLASHGFTDISIGPGRNVMEFSGNAGQVRSGFHTEIHHYTVEGKVYSANSADPEIPATLTPVVAGIVSLHNFPKQSHAKFLGQFRRTIGKSGLEPLFTFPNPFNGQTFYGMGPGDFATIYNSKPLIAAGNDGTGQTIAIVGETNINVADVQAFRQMFGLTANFSASNVILNGEDPGITSIGEEGEADLDVEWSGATAPGATVKFVVSASTPASAGIDLSALYIVENNLAAVMSESYGECEAGLGTAGNAFYNTLWEQAAAQGITIILSSGDGGSAGCDDFGTQQVATHGLAVSGLASTPFNVSLGGTDFDEVNRWTSFWSASNDPVTGTSALSYIPEIPWNQNCAQISLTGCGPSAPNGSLNIVAGSGGQSSIYSKPKWQMGVTGMPNDSHRDQPDVSLFASPGFDGTGYVYCQSDQTISGAQTCNLNTSTGTLDFGVVGGTSASAPAFAGIMALVNQYQAAHSGSNRQGNANYVLYALANKSGASCTSSTTEASTCIFNDVTKGNSFLPTGLPGVGTNSVPCQGGSPNCSISVAGSNGVLVDPSHTSTEAWTAAAGYDMTSGLGSVNANNLATNWGSVSTVPTSTTLTLSPTTGITHGTAENVSVNITVSPSTGTGVPTGDVSLIATFSDGTTHGLDQFTLASGAINGAKTQSLPGGTYTVSAHYAGDGTNAPSNSSSVQITVGPETSQTFIVVPSFDSSGTLLNGNATSVTYGSNYIIRMYATDKNAVASTTGPPNPTCSQENILTCPSGTVTLTDNGALLGTGGGGFGVYNLNNFGYTRDIAPTLTVGTYSLVAQYSGDGSYAQSSGADVFTVTQAPTSSVIGQWQSSVTVGTPFQVVVGGNSQEPFGAAPTGTITFFDGTTQVGTPVQVTGAPGGSNSSPSYLATGSVILSTGGMHNLTAKYSGDTNYASSTTQAVAIQAFYATNTTVLANPSVIPYGSSVQISVSVTTNVKTPGITGSVVYQEGSQLPKTIPTTTSTDANGNTTMTATLTATPQGSEFVNARYAGDSNFAGSSGSASIQVNIPDFTLNVPATPVAVTAGQPGSVSFTVTPATNMSSPVTLSCGEPFPAGYVCNFQPPIVNLANGVVSNATLMLTVQSQSSQAVRAASSKRSGFMFRPTNMQRLIGLICAVSALFLMIWPGQRKQLSAALGLSLVCFAMLFIGCGGGSGSGSQPPPPPSATTTTISTSTLKVAPFTQVTLTATVSGGANPTGTVNFNYNGGSLGQGTLTNGTATLLTSFGTPGVYSITAQYSGDSRNLTSTSAALNQAVTGTVFSEIVGQTGSLSHTATLTVTVN